MDISNLKDTIERIDKFLVNRKEAIRRGEMLNTLKKNPQFIEVILNGYIKAEEEKLFKILTDPSGASEYTDEQIHLQLASISNFKKYIGTDTYPGTVVDAATRAPNEIFKEEQYRKEITAEFAENGE